MKTSKSFENVIMILLIGGLGVGAALFASWTACVWLHSLMHILE